MSEKREKEPEPRRGLSLYGGNDTVKPYMYMYVSVRIYSPGNKFFFLKTHGHTNIVGLTPRCS